MTLAVNTPSGIQTPDQQLQVIQQALAKLQQGVNQGLTAPAVLLHLPSTTDSTVRSTTSASFVALPGYSWTINSQGGLVCIEAILNGAQSSFGQIALFNLLIDGKVVLSSNWTSENGSASPSSGHVAFSWKAILGKGQHVIAFQYRVTGGTLSVNGTALGAVTSSVNIIEFPANISNLNVAGH